MEAGKFICTGRERIEEPGRYGFEYVYAEEALKAAGFDDEALALNAELDLHEAVAEVPIGCGLEAGDSISAEITFEIPERTPGEELFDFSPVLEGGYWPGRRSLIPVLTNITANACRKCPVDFICKARRQK